VQNGWPTLKKPLPAGPQIHLPNTLSDGRQLMETLDAEFVRSADEDERRRIWADWVKEFGASEASRLWLAIFAATDAPKTG